MNTTRPGGHEVPRSGSLHIDDDGSGYLDDPRHEVTQLVPAGRRVLDVGCSRGAFGAELKRRVPSRYVCGVEPTAAVAHARARLDEAVQGYFPADIPATWRDFDVVCFNDVLEHLADPWTVLRDTVGLLAPGGSVVASIPNVRFLDVALDLLVRGEWRYAETGVLDRTHVRFFTSRSMQDLFHDCGYDIVTIHATHLDEAHSLPARIIRRCGLSSHFRDLLAQRFVVIARPAATRAGRADEPVDGH